MTGPEGDRHKGEAPISRSNTLAGNYNWPRGSREPR